MNHCEICGKELIETYALEWKICEECRNKNAEIEQHEYESSVRKPTVRKYLRICIINLLVCVALALTSIPYWGDGSGDSYFAFIRTWVLIINYAVHTPLLCLHIHLHSKQSKGLILSLIVHLTIALRLFHASVVFWTYI